MGGTDRDLGGAISGQLLFFAGVSLREVEELEELDELVHTLRNTPEYFRRTFGVTSAVIVRQTHGFVSNIKDVILDTRNE